MNCSPGGSSPPATTTTQSSHCTVLAQCCDHARHGRAALADGAVDADHVAAPLVEDGVDRDGRLAGLPVADDQLALAAADRDCGIDQP